MNKFIVLGVLLLVFLLAGCSSTPEQPVVPADDTAEPELSEPADQPPAEEPPPEPEPEPEPDPEPIEEEPEPEPQQSVEPEEEPAEQQEEQGDAVEYVPTQETYDRTFAEVEETISKLNEIIRNRDYEEWKDYLTRSYYREMSSPEMLEELSSHRILKRNNIVLESLEDYFNYVVVPSRANARLDDLVFRTDEKVEAIMIIQDQRVILYQLEKTNGTWKITTF